MNPLDDAIQLAAYLHSGQVDKQGEPYILHPLRVMLAVRGAGLSEDAQVAAVLHDAVEDCCVEVTKLGLYNPRVRGLVELLTCRDGEPYGDYIGRILSSGEAEARQIKLADIADNVSRLSELDEVEAERLGAKYREAIMILGGV